MGLTARPRKLLWIFGSLLLVASLVLVQCKLAEQRFYFRVVPHGMPVEGIAYQSEESWGLPFMAMPGDSETGIRLFNLAPEVIEDFRRHGAAAGAHYGHQFGEAWKVNDPRRRGLYSEWKETPHIVERWGKSGEKRFTTLAEYHGRYGFPIAVRRDVRKTIDGALGRRGNYYSVGRSGVFIVMPDQGLGAFLYAG